MIRRQLDAGSMTVLYGESDDNVINNPELNLLFETRPADILPLLRPAGDRAGDIKELRLFLRNGADGQAATRLDLLTAINGLLAIPPGSRLRKITTTGPNQYAGTANLQAIHDMVVAASGPTRALLRPVALKTNSCQLLLDLAPQVGGPWGIQAVVALVAASAGNPANPQLLRADIRGWLQAAHAVLPPGAVHPALQWGVGNSDPPSVAANIRDHARKHMLRLANADNKDPDEPRKWMQALGYTITRAEVLAQVDPIPPADDAAMFDGNALVTTPAQANHFFNDFLPRCPALIGWLLGKYQDQFRDYLVARAATMQQVMVTADAGKVQIVGQAGDLFIAGRWEPGVGFTLSSGYFNTTKHAQNVPLKAWSLI